MVHNTSTAQYRTEQYKTVVDDLRAFGINADQWTTAAQDEGKWLRTNVSWQNGSLQRKSRLVCPNVTGRTKKRIAQSKRARAGSLALVD